MRTFWIVYRKIEEEERRWRLEVVVYVDPEVSFGGGGVSPTARRTLLDLQLQQRKTKQPQIKRRVDKDNARDYTKQALDLTTVKLNIN
jgi:hypothetical protein